MRTVRIRTTLTCTILASAVIAGGMVSTASAVTDGHRGTAHHQAALPAAPDPTAALSALGALGGVTEAVAGLASSATAKPAPSPADLTAKLTALADAGKALTAALPAAPAKKTTHKSSPSDVVPPLPVPVPPLPVPAPPLPVPLPGGIGDALATLQKDATALVAAITAVDPAKITAALTSLVTDTLAVVTGTVAALGLGALPIPVPGHQAP
jgi:hypothetical protein